MSDEKNAPELDDAPVLPLEEDTVEEQIEGEHPDGDYPDELYDEDGQDEPLEGEFADEEEEGTV